MIKTKDWTNDELKILLAAVGRPPAQAVDRVPNRAATAIGAVRKECIRFARAVKYRARL